MVCGGGGAKRPYFVLEKCCENALRKCVYIADRRPEWFAVILTVANKLWRRKKK